MYEKILVVDDEVSIVDILKYNLEKEGYQVTSALDGQKGLELALEEPFDFMILDVMLPSIDGMAITQKLRQEKIDTPILMLTAKAETEDKVEGLDKGADDYLTKPFEKDELLARIRALVRKNENRTKKIKIGNVTLDKEENELYSDKASFHLNSKES